MLSKVAQVHEFWKGANWAYFCSFRVRFEAAEGLNVGKAQRNFREEVQNQAQRVHRRQATLGTLGTGSVRATVHHAAPAGSLRLTSRVNTQGNRREVSRLQEVAC